MKPIIPYKLLPLSDEELAEQIEICKEHANSRNIEPRFNPWMLRIQTHQAVLRFLSNFPIGSEFELNGVSTLVFKHVERAFNRFDRCGEQAGITVLVIIKDKGVPAKVEHIHLTVEFLREYTKDWPIA
jgi:uncharacterized protein (UPF0371 family)